MMHTGGKGALLGEVSRYVREREGKREKERERE